MLLPFFPLTSSSRSLIKDIQHITMLAVSHKPFAFKILPINLYSSKILPGNYPLTVGIDYPRIPNAVVSMSSRGFRVEGSDNEVRVPDVVLRCVGFVGEVSHEDSSGVSGDLCATGFFIFGPVLIARAFRTSHGVFRNGCPRCQRPQ